mmetsp:Transcript_126972/g.367541  ORF Transcript_126972/g.367541 Transcript_126972/m.367541 type:complete len:234 (+) Transcript_126972:995-1696(+)
MTANISSGSEAKSDSHGMHSVLPPVGSTATLKRLGSPMTVAFSANARACRPASHAKSKASVVRMPSRNPERASKMRCIWVDPAACSGKSASKRLYAKSTGLFWDMPWNAFTDRRAPAKRVARGTVPAKAHINSDRYAGRQVTKFAHRRHKLSSEEGRAASAPSMAVLRVQCCSTSTSWCPAVACKFVGPKAPGAATRHAGRSVRQTSIEAVVASVAPKAFEAMAQGIVTTRQP